MIRKKNKKLYLVDLSYYSDSAGDSKPIKILGFPLGLMSIATLLKKKFPLLAIKIINLGAECGSEEELIEQIRLDKPDFIGIRALSTNKLPLISILSKIKKLFLQIILIVGGPYVSSINDKKDFKELAADIFVIGEGEKTAGEIFERLLNNRNYDDIKGTVVRRGNEYIFNPQRELTERLDDIPFPDYDLVDREWYFKQINWGYTKNRYALIESSRGCPFGCIYCHNLFGRKTRLRNAKAVFDEISRLHSRYGISEFFFTDDIFNIDYKRANEICDRIIKEKLKIHLHFPNGLRGDLLDKPLIDKLIRAGTVSAAFAFETSSERLQKYINKNINLSKLKDNVDYACEKGIMVRLFFMYGFPTETEAEVLETLFYMKQFKKCILPYFFAAKYYKNTKMYSLALREGFDEKKLDELQVGLYHEVNFCQTPLLSREFLQKIYYRWFKEVILDKERMLNALSIQRRYLSDEEISLFYSSFFGKEIKNTNELLALCR